MQILEKHPGLTDVTRSVGITFHNYGRNIPADPPCQIDYIVLSSALCCSSVCKWTDQESGVYLSDHYPVCAEISFCRA